MTVILATVVREAHQNDVRFDTLSPFVHHVINVSFCPCRIELHQFIIVVADSGGGFKGDNIAINYCGGHGKAPYMKVGNVWTRLPLPS